MNINQEHLIIFKTVIETGSFSAAARQLGKVPSAISMSIANLEIDLNIQLFHRIGREPIPTDAAQNLYQKTLYLLSEMNQWKQHALSLGQGLETSLNIVIASELIYTQWIDYILALENQFPTLDIHIFTAPQEDALDLLAQGQVQFALLFEREILDHREEFVELFSETIVPIAHHSHPLAQLKRVTLQDLFNYRQIIVTTRNHTVKPELLFSKTYWRTNQHHLALSMIQQGLGWGFIPIESLKIKDQNSIQLNTLDLKEFTSKLSYFVDLVWYKENALGLASQFLIAYAKQQHNK